MVGGFQGCVLIWQAYIFSREFVSSHRPRLRLRRVYFDGFSDVEFMPLFLTVINVGETKGTVIHVTGEFYRKDGVVWLDGRPDTAKGGSPVGKQAVFVPGEPRGWTLTAKRRLLPGEAQAIRDGKHQLWAIGEIRYRDDYGTVRATGFGRLYSPTLGDFTICQGVNEYEYED
jgi:hypothetical protein